jgi:hypothetical protein
MKCNAAKDIKKYATFIKVTSSENIEHDSHGISILGFQFYGSNKPFQL